MSSKVNHHVEYLIIFKQNCLKKLIIVIKNLEIWTAGHCLKHEP